MRDTFSEYRTQIQLAIKEMIDQWDLKIAVVMHWSNPSHVDLHLSTIRSKVMTALGVPKDSDWP
jgi:hypothetical protein